MTIEKIYNDVNIITGSRCSIIVGMNPEFKDLELKDGIGGILFGEYKARAMLPETLPLGSVFRCNFGDRSIYAVICHELKDGGWRDAPRYLKVGLDSIADTGYTQSIVESYGIVQIGGGRSGQRYGANVHDLQEAMHESKLSVDLYRFSPLDGPAADILQFPPLNFEQLGSLKSVEILRLVA